MVAADLMRRGFKIAFPYGEDWDYDLILCRSERLERVQVKYCRSNGEAQLGEGRSLLHLRLKQPRNNQREGIRNVEDYLEI